MAICFCTYTVYYNYFDRLFFSLYKAHILLLYIPFLISSALFFLLFYGWLTLIYFVKFLLTKEVENQGFSPLCEDQEEPIDSKDEKEEEEEQQQQEQEREMIIEIEKVGLPIEEEKYSRFGNGEGDDLSNLDEGNRCLDMRALGKMTSGINYMQKLDGSQDSHVINQCVSFHSYIV